MRKILGYLSEEDLERHRLVTARVQIALTGNRNMSEKDAVDALVEDSRLFQEFRERYDIDPEDAVDFSVIDGAIIDDPPEG